MQEQKSDGIKDRFRCCKFQYQRRARLQDALLHSPQVKGYWIPGVFISHSLPRLPKMRRSVSSGDLSPTALAEISDVSPIRRLQIAEGEVEEDGEENEVSIRAGLVLEQAMAKLQLQEEKEALKEEAGKAKAKVTQLEEELKEQAEQENAKIEKLEAELSTARQELKLKESEVQEAVRMKEAAERREELAASEMSVAASLRGRWCCCSRTTDLWRITWRCPERSERSWRVSLRRAGRSGRSCSPR